MIFTKPTWRITVRACVLAFMVPAYVEFLKLPSTSEPVWSDVYLRWADGLPMISGLWIWASPSCW